MLIHVLLFAAYREKAGARELTLEVSEGASLREIAAELEGRYPGLSLTGGLCARNEQYASPDEAAHPGDRVAYFPPVSGGDGPDRLELSGQRLELGPYLSWASAPAYGAVASFLGTVRSPNEGLNVSYIDYQGYDEMIRTQLRRVAAELRDRFELGRIAIVHRLGRLAPGEASILIVVSAEHRHDALAATHACIDRCKELLPVWKHEVTEEGARWVEGHPVTGATLDKPKP